MPQHNSEVVDLLRQCLLTYGLGKTGDELKTLADWIHSPPEDPIRLECHEPETRHDLEKLPGITSETSGQFPRVGVSPVLKIPALCDRIEDAGLVLEFAIRQHGKVHGKDIRSVSPLLLAMAYFSCSADDSIEKLTNHQHPILDRQRFTDLTQDLLKDGGVGMSLRSFETHSTPVLRPRGHDDQDISQCRKKRQEAGSVLRLRKYRFFDLLSRSASLSGTTRTVKLSELSYKGEGDLITWKSLEYETLVRDLVSVFGFPDLEIEVTEPHWLSMCFEEWLERSGLKSRLPNRAVSLKNLQITYLQLLEKIGYLANGLDVQPLPGIHKLRQTSYLRLNELCKEYAEAAGKDTRSGRLPVVIIHERLNSIEVDGVRQDFGENRIRGFAYIVSTQKRLKSRGLTVEFDSRELCKVMKLTSKNTIRSAVRDLVRKSPLSKFLHPRRGSDGNRIGYKFVLDIDLEKSAVEDLLRET